MKIPSLVLNLVKATTIVAQVICAFLALLLIAHILNIVKGQGPFLRSADFAWLSVQALTIAVFSSKIEKSLHRFDHGGVPYAISRYYRKRLGYAVCYPFVIILACVFVSKWAFPILGLALYPALVHAYYAIRFRRNGMRTIRAS
jgi:hypothetical protein